MHRLTPDFEDCELRSDFAGISLCENQMPLNSDARASSQSLTDDRDLGENVRQTMSPLRNAGKKCCRAKPTCNMGDRSTVVVLLLKRSIFSCVSNLEGALLFKSQKLVGMYSG